MIEFHSLEPQELERFLERHKSGFALRPEIDLDFLLRKILQKANEFVPSESGSILLDDPVQKLVSRQDNELVFIATFGPGSESLVGRKLSAGDGIAGRVYKTGAPYLSRDVAQDEYFFGKIDDQLGFKTHSIVCVPIYIGKEVCGVLELINRNDRTEFTERDMTLLEIFAGYTSFTLQNTLDAKRAHELAKRDDLTGLFNDRWFHVCLSEALNETEARGGEAVLIFMDLDNFKKINDRHGHLAGSQVLREIGFLLKRAVEREGSTVSRYGGDEFVIILPSTTLEEGIKIAETVRERIAETTFLDHEYSDGMPPLHLKGFLSASVGLANYKASASDQSIDIRKNDLLRRADEAMYQAKSQGKNRVVVAEDGPPMKSGKSGKWRAVTS